MAITKKAMLARLHRAQDEEARSLQGLIDSGTWGLEGSMGRAMMRAIEDGACVLGPREAYDYWGNFIPSRTMVRPGTKGSVEYALAMREKWEDYA